MVTEGVLGWLQDGWAWVCSEFAPHADGDGTWIDSGIDGAIWIAGTLDSLGAWLPLRAIGAVMGAAFVAWLAAGGIVILRMILSLFTGGGGSVGVS